MSGAVVVRVPFPHPLIGSLPGHATSELEAAQPFATLPICRPTL